MEIFKIIEADPKHSRPLFSSASEVEFQHIKGRRPFSALKQTIGRNQSYLVQGWRPASSKFRHFRAPQKKEQMCQTTDFTNEVISPQHEQSSKNLFPGNQRARPISASTSKQMIRAKSRQISANARTINATQSLTNFSKAMERKTSTRAFK